jgi:hypothetical protein
MRPAVVCPLERRVRRPAVAGANCIVCHKCRSRWLAKRTSAGGTGEAGACTAQVARRCAHAQGQRDERSWHERAKRPTVVLGDRALLERTQARATLAGVNSSELNGPPAGRRRTDSPRRPWSRTPRAARTLRWPPTDGQPARPLAQSASNLSRVGINRPPGVGIYRPLDVAPKGISKHPVDGVILPR